MAILIVDTSDNELSTIKPDPVVPFTAKEIVHARLQIRTRPNIKDPLYFDLELISNPPPPPPAQLSAYLAKIVDPTTPRPSGTTHSVYDIPVNQQCWIIVELDVDIPNWRFFGPGATSKHLAAGWEFGLKYVLDGDGTLQEGVIPEGAACRVLVFGISKRMKAPDHHGMINLYVEFIQGRHKVQFIIDPDIPNNGGDDIPP